MDYVLLPVPGLGVPRPWRVGRVTFHPAESASSLIAAARASEQGPASPAFEHWLAARTSVLDASAVAQVDETDDAVAQVESALSVLRIIQHVQHPMNDKSLQKFGLPGTVSSGVVDSVIVGESLTLSTARVGALAGWEFSDEDHSAWCGDPIYRFLDEALRIAEADRTGLQQRALIAAALLSQAWLTFVPDVALLNSVMAIEILLGETKDQSKKFRLARRVAYFACFWPTERRHFDGTQPACPYMVLPLGNKNGELGQRIRAVQSGSVPPECAWFYDVLDLYDARTNIVHDGMPKKPIDVARDTWFVGAVLLRPVLSWFAAHPAGDLNQLDDEIASRP